MGRKLCCCTLPCQGGCGCWSGAPKVCCECASCTCSIGVMCCKINCLVCPCLIIILLIFSWALLPVAMYQEEVLDNADIAGQLLTNILAQFAQQITPCTNAFMALCRIINKVLILVYALLAIIGDALGLTFNGQPIFSWVQNEHLARYQQTKLKKERVRNEYIAQAVKAHGVSSFYDLPLHQQHAIYYAARNHMSVVQNQVPIFDQTIACTIVIELSTFIDDFLDILDFFLVTFFQKIISALIPAIQQIANGQCTPTTLNTCLPNLIQIFIKLALDLILDTIPYGKCLNDIPMSIPRCICSITGTSNRVDTYLVGCMFKDCNVTGYANGFSAFIGCLDLKSLVKSIFSISSSTAQTNSNVVQTQIQIAELSSATQDVAISIDQLNALLTPGASMLQSDRYDMSHISRLAEFKKAKAAELRQIQETFDAHRTIVELYLNRTLVLAAGNETTTGNETEPAASTSTAQNSTYFERFLASSNTSSEDVRNVIDIHDYFVQNAEIAPHALTLMEVLGHIVNKTMYLWSLDHELTLAVAMQHYREIPIGKGYWAAKQMAIHARENRKDNYTVIPIDKYHEAVANYTKTAVDYSKFFTYSGVSGRHTSYDEQAINKQMNDSFTAWKQRNTEILQMQDARKMEANGLSIIMTISGVLSILLLGGSQIMGVNCSSICGACCAQGLNCCMTCSSCMIVLIGLIAFFGVNMITNLLTGTTDYEDIISEIIAGIGGSILNIYKMPPTQMQIINNMNTLGSIVYTSMDKIVIQAIRINVRVAMFAIPILVLPEPEPDDTVISYLEALIFYNYFAPCTMDSDCPRNGRCRVRVAPNDPSNLCERDCTSTEPCFTPMGNCTVAPFLITGYCPELTVPSFNFLINFQCNSLGYNDNDLTYTANLIFQQHGFRWQFFVTGDFWRFVWQILYAPILALRHVTRLLATMDGIPALGLFTGLLQGFPIALPGGAILPTLTAISYFLLPPIQSVIHWLHDFFAYFNFEPFIYFLSFTQWPNWAESPPYGSATVSEWSCFVIHIPSTLIGTWLWINGLAILLILLFNPISYRIYKGIWLLLWMFIKIFLYLCGCISKKSMNNTTNDYL